MAQVARRTKRALAIAVPVAVVAAGALTLAEREALGCDDTLFERPLPMARALSTPAVDKGVLARANKTSPDRLAERARADVSSLWADRCGLAFYVDEATPVSEQEARTDVAEPTTAQAPLALAPLSQTFALDSRPGAARTIYLDFRGDKVTGTAWNQSYTSSIDVPAYSIDAKADTSFSDAELTEIQRAWQVVSEDYAPFDVNVTTREPAAAKLARDSYSDSEYGVTVRISAGGPIFDACGCGGVAYVNTFNVAGPQHEFYQPAWVFTNGTGTSGKSVGEAISHEVGHNFGLSHDGTSDKGYYAGEAPWAPVMGVGYYQPVSQWSSGEYAGASQTQDDLKVIASGAPVLPDDHGDDAASATRLQRAATGVITDRGDVDAFTADVAGRTRVVVSPAASFANLDIKLTVLDASGSRIAAIDPPVSRTSATDAQGLGATWVGDVAAAGTSLTFLVDGVGRGDPRTPGGYSDYGSVGRYSIALATQDPVAPQPKSDPAPDPAPEPAPDPEPTKGPAPDPAPDPDASSEPAGDPEAQSDPLTVDWTALAAAEDGAPYRGDAGAARGGSGSYTWTAMGLPDGLRIGDGAVITGVPTGPGSYRPRLTVTDGDGAKVSEMVQIVVAPPAAAAPLSLRSTGQLPSGMQRKRYVARLFADGGAGVRTWSVMGTLPKGLRLRTNRTGSAAVLKGKPRRPGIYGFAVRVTDAGGSTASGAYQVAVAKRSRR